MLILLLSWRDVQLHGGFADEVGIGEIRLMGDFQEHGFSKFEIRKTKFETNSKAEEKSIKRLILVFHISSFFLQIWFAFRISDFEFS